MNLWPQPLVRIRPGVRTDRGGNAVPDWSPGAVERLTINQVSVQPVLQTEIAGDIRTSVISGWQVFSPPGVDIDIRSGDRVEYDGLLCEVKGEVGRWKDPLTGAIHHVEWQMRRSTG